MENTATNVYVKFNYDRLHNVKALRDFREFDKTSTSTTFVVLGNPFWVSKRGRRTGNGGKRRGFAVLKVTRGIARNLFWGKYKSFGGGIKLFVELLNLLLHRKFVV